VSWSEKSSDDSATSIEQKQKQTTTTNPRNSSRKQRPTPSSRNDYFSRNNNRINNGRRTDSNFSNDPSRKLNQELVRAESAVELLSLLQKNAKLQSFAAGNTLNGVNHSTSLHRLAKHAASTSSTASTSGNSSKGHSTYKQNRAQILSDPRFALLVASTAENMSTASSIQQIQRQQSFFQTRELSNIGWALAKLKLPPPSSAMPTVLDGRSIDDDVDLQLLLKQSNEHLAKTAELVRNSVLSVAAERSKAMQMGNAASIGSDSWIPVLSRLAGYILDSIGVTAIIMDKTLRQNPSSNLTPNFFQLQEWSNLLWAWATAGRAENSVFGLVIRNMIEQQRCALQMDHSSMVRPQEWSNSIWAFATSQCYDGHVELLEYVAELLELRSDFIKSFKSQEMSNTVWGVATLLSNKKLQQDSDVVLDASLMTGREQFSALSILRCIARSVINRTADGFRTQELSNTAWAAATLGFGINQGQGTSVLNNYLVLKSDSPYDDTQLMVEMIDAIVDSALKQLPRFWSQELNNLAWALARLLSDNNNVASIVSSEFRSKIFSLLRGIALQLADPRRSINSQDIGTTLWSFATLEFCDKILYRDIAVRLTPEQAHGSKPQELSNTIWAFATAEMEIDDKDIFDTSLVPTSRRPSKPNDPITECFGVAASELMRRPHNFKPQEIKDVLWSFSKVGLRHPVLFKFVAEHLVGSEDGTVVARGLDAFSTQGLGNMAWAFARQAQLSEEVSERLSLNSGNGRMSAYKTIYFDVGEHLLLKLFSSIAETNIRVYDNLRVGKPQDISNTAWAFAALGLKDSRYMEAAKLTLADRLTRYSQGERNGVTSFKGQELANLLWAMATINISAGSVWDSLMAYLREACADSTNCFTALSISKHFKRKELASMAWACAVLGNYPEELMHFLFVGLFGLPDKEREPKFLERIYSDSGLQMQAIMTLIYVQAEMDIRGCCQSISLPIDFPDSWKESTTSLDPREADLVEFSLGLSLSTSKIQRAVSAAFSRINFAHVEEHTITMKEMAEVHGVRVPATNIEVLSIDIANLEQKVAIEVDGPSHFISRIDDFDEMESRSTGFSKVIRGKLEYQFGWTGERQEMNGPTILKERLLKSFGWKVIHLPFWEWYALGGDASAEEIYCQALLERCSSLR
jgi:RAP domain